MRRRLGLLALLAALAAGCQGAPPPPEAVAPAADETVPVSAAAAAAAQGDALMREGHYAAAAAQYRRAVAAEPDAVSHRFALGSAYSYLDRHRDAAELFTWVVKHADPAGEVHRAARRWLASAGVPVRDPTGEAPAGSEAEASAGPEDPSAETPLVGGRLVGSSEWPGIDPAVRAVSGEMALSGIEGATETVKRFRPIRLGGRYHFHDLAPGKYRLVVRMAHHPEDVTLWDETVMVADGEPTELNLTPATARRSPDEFPPPLEP
jgi:hypothetical protein